MGDYNIASHSGNENQLPRLLFVGEANPSVLRTGRFDSSSKYNRAAQADKD
jgi:hypothetical protein